ncbi:MAG: MFS transporter [Acidimicrobiia bacterium]|nr:MFS transporter [Acidimicrobiia bacterium]
MNPDPPRQFSKTDLWAVSASTAIVMLGQGMIAPVLPLYAESFGVDLAAVGIALAAFALARLVLNIPLGAAADRWGRRPLLMGGPAVVAAGMVGSALAPGIGALIAWRFVAGAGSAMYMTAALVYLTDIAPPVNRARYIAVNQAALRLGVTIGPVVGGLIAEQFGFRAPFFLVAALATLAAVHGWARLQETRPTSRVPARGQNWRPLIRSKPFVAVAFVSLAVFFTRGTIQFTLIPLQGANDYQLSSGQIGLILSGIAGTGLALLGPAAWLADRFGRRAAIIPSLFGTGMALVLFATADSTGSFLVASGALALAVSISGPAAAAFTADIAPPALRGRAFGIYRSAGDLGLLIGPPLLGAVADAGGFPPAYLINGAVVAAVAIGFAVWGRPPTADHSPGESA